MLLQPYNELRFNVRLVSTSPVLIKESRFSPEDRERWSEHSNEAVQKATRRRMPQAIPISRATQQQIKAAVLNPSPLASVEGFKFFLPAASLRGVCRTHLERALRAFDLPDDPRICDPFEEGEGAPTLSCSSALTQRKKLSEDEFQPYTFSCPACRLFGSTLQASRITFTDAERVANTGSLVQREHVQINRRKGSVTGAPLKVFGLDNAEFDFAITLSNFELPHVLLIGILLADLKAGNITVGSGRSKGYGRVALKTCGIQLSYFGLVEPDHRLRGVAEHADEKWKNWFCDRYGITSGGDPPPLTSTVWVNSTPWRWQRALDFAEFDSCWRKLRPTTVGPLSARLQLSV